MTNTNISKNINISKNTNNIDKYSCFNPWFNMYYP